MLFFIAGVIAICAGALFVQYKNKRKFDEINCITNRMQVQMIILTKMHAKLEGLFK